MSHNMPRCPLKVILITYKTKIETIERGKGGVIIMMELEIQLRKMFNKVYLRFVSEISVLIT